MRRFLVVSGVAVVLVVSGAAITLSSRKPARIAAPVLIASRTTETDQYWSQPDGSVTWREYAQPVRVKRGNGWVPVDPTLRRQVDGSVAAMATPVAVTMSGGGRLLPLVTAGQDGVQVGLSWDGDLPAPSLEGATATYSEVLPGVDLKVTASPGGFSELLVVKSPSPSLLRVSFGSYARNATVRVQDGRLEAVDTSGRVVFTGDASRMWDSAGATATMGVELTDDHLSIVPDQAFLGSPATTYPVFLDPEYYCAGALWCGKQHHVVVQSGFAGAHNLDATSGDLVDLKAGWENYDSAAISRSYVQMNTAPIVGKHIHWANLNTTLLYSWWGPPSATPTDMYVTSAIDGGTTWLSPPGWTQYVSSSNATNQGQAPNAAMVFPAGSVITTAAQQGWANATFMLRGSHEGDTTSWRRFGLNPYLEVNFDSWPLTPANLSMQNSAVPCAQGVNRPWVFSRTPQLAGVVADPDGGAVTASYGMDEGPNGAVVAGTHHDVQVGVGTPGPGQGATAGVTVPAGWITHDGTYSWLMSAFDGELWSGETQRCEFTVDSTVPSTPTLTATGTAPLRQGDPATFTIRVGLTTPSLYDIDRFVYSTDGTEPTVQGSPSVPANRLTDSSTGTSYASAGLAITAVSSNQNLVKVKAVNRAGTAGPDATCAGPWLVASGTAPNMSCVFTVLPVIASTDLRGAWSLDDPTPASLVDNVAALNPGATAHPLNRSGNAVGWLGYNRGNSWTGPARDVVPAGQRAGLHFGGNTGVAATAGPVLDTTRSFTVAAWALLDDTASAHAVIAQENATSAAMYLQYDQTDQRWHFCLPSADGPHPPQQVATSNAPALAGVWTHLVGTYDAVAGVATLYVDGVKQSAVTAHPIASTGSLVLGAVQWNGARTNYLTGVLDDVQVWQRVLSQANAHDLASTATPRAQYGLAEGAATLLATPATGDPLSGTYVPAPVPSLQGFWQLDGNTTDTSNHGAGYGSNPLALTGGVTMVAGKAGSGLHFDGAAGSTAISREPAIDTSNSFTLSAWAKLDDITNFSGILGQSGAGVPGFLIRYSPDVHAWIFGMTGAEDPTGASIRWAYAPNSVFQAGDWTLVTGVFDRSANQILMYVNGMLAGTNTFTGTPWNATGPVTVGGYSLGGTMIHPLHGSVDQVRLWQQALTASQVAGLAGMSYVDGVWNSTGPQAAPVVGTVPVLADGGAARAQYTGAPGNYLNGPRPALFRTDHSYTVEAWVRVDNLAGGTGTAVSIADADHMPMGLSYQPEWDGRWSFVVSSDATHTGSAQLSDGHPVDGRWTHLAGTYDAATGTACLYVNGQLQHSTVDGSGNATGNGGCSTNVSGWTNGGTLAIGTGFWSGGPANRWHGGVAGVRLYAGIRTPSEIHQDLVADDPGLLFGVNHG